MEELQITCSILHLNARASFPTSLVETVISNCFQTNAVWKEREKSLNSAEIQKYQVNNISASDDSVNPDKMKWMILVLHLKIFFQKIQHPN